MSTPSAWSEERVGVEADGRLHHRQRLQTGRFGAFAETPTSARYLRFPSSNSSLT